jgi:hypothetical protein
LYRGIAALVASVIVLSVSPTQAATKEKSRQYVFVVDDSGSMRFGGRDFRKGSDHDRLALFGVQVMLQVLEDKEGATVVSLNGSAKGEAIHPMAALSQNRAPLMRLVETNPEGMAKYTGGTPCKKMMDSVGVMLNEVDRPGVEQLVFYLTDGACSGAWRGGAGARAGAKSWLKSINSHNEGRLRFQLIRWEGGNWTRALEEVLRKKTNGAEVPPIRKGDATAVVMGLLDALARSRGVPAHEATPGNARLPAFRGAKRVSLLTIASGRAATNLRVDLSVEKEGKAPGPLMEMKRGDFKWPGNSSAAQASDPAGQRYSWVLSEYEPGTNQPVVEVSGTSAWKVIAVPHYAFITQMNTYAQKCPADDNTPLRQPTTSLKAGESMCVEVRLLNDEGKVLDKDVVPPGSEAKVYYSDGSSEEEASYWSPKRVGSGKTVWRLNRDQLAEGDLRLNAGVQLIVDGVLMPPQYGGSETIQVSSDVIAPEPAQFELGTLTPGTTTTEQITLSAGLPEHQVRAVFPKKGHPRCVSVQLNGKRGEQWQPVSWGQPMTLVFDIASFCGTESGTKQHESLLTFEFKPKVSGSTRNVQVMAKFDLENQFDGPSDLLIQAESGEFYQRDLRFQTNSKEPVKTAIGFELGSNWPSAEDLQIGFYDTAEEEFISKDDEDGQAQVVQMKVFPLETNGGANTHSVPIGVQVGPCCQTNVYEGQIFYQPGGQNSRRIPIALKVDVTGAGFLACWGQALIRWLLYLLVALLIGYLYLMWANSCWFKKDSLKRKVWRLSFDDTGDPVSDENDAAWKNAVDDSLKFAARVGAWFRANPLKTGLPGGKYHETLRVTLSDRCRLGLVALGNASQLSQGKTGDKGRGVLYVAAKSKRGSVGFYGFPRRDSEDSDEGEISGFGYEPCSADSETGYDDVSGRKLLRKQDRYSRRPDEGDLAGWALD